MPNTGENILPTKKMPSKEARKTYVEAAVSTSTNSTPSTSTPYFCKMIPRFQRSRVVLRERFPRRDPAAQRVAIACKEPTNPSLRRLSARGTLSATGAVGRIRSRIYPKVALLNFRCDQQRHRFAAFVVDSSRARPAFGSGADCHPTVEGEQLARPVIRRVACELSQPRPTRPMLAHVDVCPPSAESVRELRAELQPAHQLRAPLFARVRCTRLVCVSH